MARSPLFAAGAVAILSLLGPGVAPGQPPADADAYARAEMQRQLEEFNKISHQIQARVREAREKGNRLNELLALRALEGEYGDQGSLARQAVDLNLMEATIELGNYARALEIADRTGGRRAGGEPAETALAGYAPHDAVDIVLALAEEHPIVLVNEAHHVPQHRAFTHRLLRELRARGFEYFAAETLWATDTELQERGYPITRTGSYIPEPVCADLVRTALRLGYGVIPYEASFPTRDRETGQAKHLMERIFEKDPKAKVLVHAGYAHIHESGLLAGVKTMAQRLTEMTGIDPLTLDQTVMTEHGSPPFEHPTYRYVIEKHAIRDVTVFRQDDGTCWSNDPALTDLTVFSPRTVLDRGRPTWLTLAGARSAFELPEQALAAAVIPCFVRARVVGESEDAVPIDRVEITASRKAPALLLPDGTFQVEIVDATDRVLWNQRVTIPRPEER